MNIRQLKQYLSEFKDEDEIMFRHPSHDYWRNELASEIQGLEYGRVKFTDYHGQDQVIDDEDTAERKGARKVVLIG